VSKEAFLSTSNVVNRSAAAGEAYNAPSDPLAGGEGAGCPLPKNTTPALGPSGLEPHGFWLLFSCCL